MKTGVASWSRPEALNALIWLTENGIDTVVSDEPRAWLDTEQAAAPVAQQQPQPDTVENGDFSGISSGDATDRDALLPVVEGASNSHIGLLLDADPRAGARQILPTVDGKLLERMIAAIGLKLDEVIRLGFAVGSTGQAMREQAAAHPAEVLLLMGDGPSKALLGKPAAQVRGEAHRIDLGGREVTAFATFAPVFLMQQPRMKALAWADLRLFAAFAHSRSARQ